METINNIIMQNDVFLWGIPLIVLILTCGITLSFRIRFLQIRKLGKGFKYMLHDDDSGHGDVSSFAALCTALSATVGTGNIVGVATAVSTGGA
ncbi:MAG: sodium:alanine symporter family protein, partial [Ruminiclostridium sp.]|nr:sodium:alanine symporter family protein [Ruminiclostridium sp.]